MARKGIDNGFTATLNWLSDWYGELDDVTVNHIALPAITVTAETVLNDHDYQAASVGKQPPLHVYLKYRVLKWCKEQHGADSPKYEVKMYFPIGELIDLRKKYGLRSEGINFDVAKPQLLPKQKDDEYDFMDCTNGEVIIVDVYSNRIVYEIGYTTPFNLITPMLEGLADRAVWIQFPKGVKPDIFDITNGNDTVFHGYEIVADVAKLK